MRFGLKTALLALAGTAAIAGATWSSYVHPLRKACRDAGAIYRVTISTVSGPHGP